MMPVKHSEVQAWFTIRIADKDAWSRIKSRAALSKISINDLILTLLTAWAEDRIEIKKEEKGK